MNSSRFVEERIKESIAVKEDLINKSGVIEKIALEMIKGLRENRKVVLFGNGGSAADAQHIAAELSGQLYIKDRPGLPAISLTTNTSTLTAIGNDYGYDLIFSKQVEGIVNKGDIVLGISTSGNSQNVLNGIQKANEIGAITVGFSGNGGLLKDKVDFSLEVSSGDTPRIQECHILAGHIICELVESELFTNG